MPDVRVITTAEAPSELLRELRDLLDAAFSGDGGFTDDDWDHTVGGRHVLVSDGAVLVAHASVVPRELHLAGRLMRTGYVEGVASLPSRRGEGLGATVTARATELVAAEFEMGGLSTGLDFYARWGWERWRGPTYARHQGVAVRTADDDDSVMVLRFGAGADVDLFAPISCEARRGDDW